MVPAIIGTMLTSWFASDVLQIIRVHINRRFERGYHVWTNVAVMVRRDALPPVEPDDHVSSVLIVTNPMYVPGMRDIATLKMFQSYAAEPVLWAHLLCL